jgi:alkyl hydroperoxide reductase subunit D
VEAAPVTLEDIKGRLPEYAKDLKLNLSSILNTPDGMTPQQLWGSLLVAAIASRNAALLQAVVHDASAHLDEAAVNGAKAAAAMMAMNNVYYRFLHLASNKEYGKFPARLRMNIIANPGVDKVDFELWSLVVSAINGCGICIDSHEKLLLDQGMAKTTIQHGVRIGSVIHAIAVTLDAEDTFSGNPAAI